ncbi:DUF86 domain-containing protein [Candidatus Pacearchaeota archaeon]|nr:DUF86 domain-containing protein [Candidatus Pacearchaeota archaeon]
MNNLKKLREATIISKLKELNNSLEFIEDNLPKEYEDFKISRLLRNGIYKELEFALENVLDICSIINSDLGLGMPEVEDNILDNLEGKKIFAKKIVEIIRDMKRFRNILVHKYGKINDSIAFETISDGLKDFEMIINEIEKVIKKYKNNQKIQ